MLFICGLSIGILCGAVLEWIINGRGALRWIRPAKPVPNPQAAFAYTQRYLSGHTLTIGFESMDDCHRAHEIASRQFFRRAPR